MKAPWTLINGELRHMATPHTFDIPDPRERLAAHNFRFVKIGLEHPTDSGERFWVTHVRRLPDGRFQAEVANNLVYSLGHGYSIGSLIEFGPEHVLMVDVLESRAP